MGSTSIFASRLDLSKGSPNLESSFQIGGQGSFTRLLEDEEYYNTEQLPDTWRSSVSSSLVGCSFRCSLNKRSRRGAGL